MSTSPSFLIALVMVLGSGTIVPLGWKVYSERRQRKRPLTKYEQVQIEDLASQAAREAVEATRGALTILRQQLQDGQAEIVTLRKERARDANEIERLRNRIRELTR